MKRQFYWLLVIVLLLHFALLAWPRPAYACNCAPPPPPATAMAQADSVFVGKATNTFYPLDIPGMRHVITFLGLWDRLPSQFYIGRHSFKVKESWKGIVTTRVTVLNIGPCGYYFHPGQEYVVYANESDGKHYSHLCMATFPINQATDDLAFLRTQPTLPLTTVVPWYTFCTLSILPFLILAGALWRTRHHR